MSGEIGKILRETREARGMEVDEVAGATKIRPRYLHALEAEQWDVLPGRAYARAFLRTYAEHLGLDPEPLGAELERELASSEAAEEVPPEPIVQPGTLPTGLRAHARRALVAVAAIAAIAAVAALVLTSGDGDGSAPPAGPPADEETLEPDDPGESPDPGEPEPPDEEPEEVSLRLAAAGPVWVCVVRGSGEALVDGETLAEGDERGPLEARRLLMTFGNGQIEATADGEPIEVPDAAEPIGFELTADGVEELGSEDQPSCA